MRMMEVPKSALTTLLGLIIERYFIDTYCTMIISDGKLDLSTFPRNLTYVTLTDNDANLLKNIFRTTEMGCANYIVQMQDHKDFNDILIGITTNVMFRKHDRKVVFVPPFCEDVVILELFKLREISFLANAIAIVADNETYFDIYTHKYIGNDSEINDPIVLDTWSVENSFQNGAELFPYDLSDLGGKSVRVACFQYLPFSVFDVDKSLAQRGRDGLSIRLVDEFCDWINCTMVPVRDDEANWGVLNNETATGVLGATYTDTADLGATSVAIWHYMHKYIDCTTYTIRAGVNCAAPAPQIIPRLDLPILPFSGTTWIIITLMNVLATVILICFGMKVDMATDVVGRVIMGQAPRRPITDWRVRRFTFWLLLSALVLDNVYCSGLAAIFTQPKYDKTVDTARDLAESGMEWGGTDGIWVYSLSSSDDPTIKKVVKQFRALPEDVLHQRGKERSIAFGVEEIQYEYSAIGNYVTSDIARDYRLLKETLYYEYEVVLCRKNSVYKDKLNQFIGRLHEGGMFLAWNTEMAIKYLDFEVQILIKYSRQIHSEFQTKALQLFDVLGIFVVYGSGVIIATSVFITEIIIHKNNNKKARIKCEQCGHKYTKRA